MRAPPAFTPREGRREAPPSHCFLQGSIRKSTGGRKRNATELRTRKPTGDQTRNGWDLVRSRWRICKQEETPDRAKTVGERCNVIYIQSASDFVDLKSMRGRVRIRLSGRPRFVSQADPALSLRPDRVLPSARLHSCCGFGRISCTAFGRVSCRAFGRFSCPAFGRVSCPAFGRISCRAFG